MHHPEPPRSEEEQRSHLGGDVLKGVVQAGGLAGRGRQHRLLLDAGQVEQRQLLGTTDQRV